jgi:UDP-glucose 4-epimerase
MKMNKSKRPRRGVILGAGGFIGINLTSALAAEGYEVVCFDRHVSPHWPSQAKAVTGDFAAVPTKLLEELEDSIVFDLVSSCRPSQNTNQAADEVVADVAATLRYLEQTRGRNIRWIFVSSGGTVYGPAAASPTTEESPTQPICSYGLVKLTIEKYFDLYRKIHQTDYIVARVSNPYGPWQHPMKGQGIVAALVLKALTNQKIEIWGDGENIRDYLYIDDTISALITLAEFGRDGEIYNVSGGAGTSINELIGMIGAALGSHISANYVEARLTDVRKSVLDNSKLRVQTGWAPKVGLQEGILATSNWISEQKFVIQG